ncbi:MAG: hypothetical protein DRN95_04835 [Candidatus Hydrothermarchaeota archaeon]|nr:MAG: hypothetical protein DRN95_04835 [Candidatus Hydrothermarchaeota archaeon]
MWSADTLGWKPNARLRMLCYRKGFEVPRIKVKLSDFEKTWPEAARREFRSHILPWFVFRHTGKLLAWLFLRVGLTANCITVASILCAIIGSLLIAVYVGNLLLTYTGIILLWMWAILDATDGRMARIVGPTKLGDFLDRFAADVKRAFLYPCVAVRAVQEPGYVSVIAADAGITPTVILVCGFATSILFLWSVSTTCKFKTIFGSAREASAIGRGHEQTPSLRRRLFVIGTNIYEFEFVFLLIAPLVKVWDCMTLFYLLFAVGILFITLFGILRSAAER